MVAQIKYMILFTMSVVANMIITLQINCVEGDPEVPCFFFLFGDSLVDNGNNNPRATLAKANYRPYGIDFPGGIPTGSLTMAEPLLTFLDYRIIVRNLLYVRGQRLEFVDSIPPFATAADDVILRGVNYASEAAGIRDETGYQVGYVVSLNKQLHNHNVTIWRITALLRNRTAAQNHLNKCLYYVGMGNNDYLNNYFLPQFCNTSTRYTPEEDACELINQYSNQITRLYNLGARKVALIGVGVLGCIPYVISTYGTNGSACVDRFNNAAQIFNGKLVALVDELNTRYSAVAKFIYVNSFEIGSGDPTSFSFI